jgi:acyl-CoA thioester hydrolase
VEFSETDMAGIVHYSNYFRYMERAEHAWFRSLGLTVFDQQDNPLYEKVGWPRVHASCDYRLPLRFEEEFEVELLVEAVRPRSLRYLFYFWNKDGKLVATGRMSVACVKKDSQTSQLRSVEIPVSLRSLIEAVPAHLLEERASR